MADITRVCKDCGVEFVITEQNQKWFEDHGLQLPVRCPDCRKKRKAAKAEAFKKGGRK